MSHFTFLAGGLSNKLTWNQTGTRKIFEVQTVHLKGAGITNLSEHFKK